MAIKGLHKVFITALLTIAKIWKSFKYQQVNINKLWYNKTLEYYLGIQEMNHNTCSNINITDIMSRERKQKRYTLYVYISMKTLEKTNLIHNNRNHISGCLGIV